VSHSGRSGDRNATFQLKNGVAIYGGFPRGGGWPQRNPLRYQTILSGDLGEPGATADNSYHVVTASEIDRTAVLDGCVITGGWADGSETAQDKGAGLYCLRGSPQVRNCVLAGNTATGQGGGAYLATSDATFINCVFTGNTANDGGALYSAQGTVAMLNCTVVANQGLWRASLAGATTLTNSIVWGNPGRPNRSSYDDVTQISGPVPPAIHFCCVQGWKDSWGGNGNFGNDPLFVNLQGADHVAGTLGDDLRLQAGSPCIDQGDNTALPPEITTDLEGKPRVFNGTVDLGTYEFGGSAVNQ
jgi:parallel beta-helix repeat protein